MKRLLTGALAGLAVLAFASPALAADPQPVTPFPASQSGDVFTIGQTVTADGAISNYFAPGSMVNFRAYAVDAKSKTNALLIAKDVRYFYITLPNQPNVKLKYTPTSKLASGRYAWTGSWTVPADYKLGQVDYKLLVQAVNKHRGSFVQLPVATAFLAISKTPQLPGGPGPAAKPTTGQTASSVVVYADAVNGSRPVGTAVRPIGCTQTNVFKRGEQVVIRSWGFDLAAGTVLSMDNILEASFTVPGQSKLVMNWGGHGPTGIKVWFWANAWVIPADFPLGDTNVAVTFSTVSGKVGTFDYPITIIP